MKNILSIFILVFSILSMSQTAQAYKSYHSSSSGSEGGNGWQIQPGGIYYFTTEGGNPPYSSNTTVTREVINLLAGYRFNYFYIGANYNYDAIVTSGGGNPTSTDSFRGYGGNLGLMTDNIFLIFTYYFSSYATTGAGSPTPRDLNNGTGYQATFGYEFDMGSGFGVGPQLTYKNLSYSSLASGASTSFTYTTLIPEINIRYTF